MRTMISLLFYLSSATRSLLKNYWAQRLDFPCNNVQWTCEHVVPRSLIAEHNDLHNLILLPGRLNNARSNYPYIHDSGLDKTIQKIIWPCFNKGCHCNTTGTLVSKRLFIPPDLFKGMIARSVLFMDEKYPHHHDLIHKKVLDLGVASMWDCMFPATKQEAEWDKIISSIQGDSNHFTINSYHHR